MRAFLKNYRQSPRKVRLVARLIKGKSVDLAETELGFLTKRASIILIKLLRSAISNAKNNSGIDKTKLLVKELRVDKGVTLKRFRPRAFGRASSINKRSSHITLILGEQSEVKGQEQKIKSKHV